MADHDQRIKNLLCEYFAEFFQLFFPAWAARFDFSTVEWLNQEVFPDPPQGQRRVLDIVAKLATREPVPAMRSDQGDNWIALVHVEIESADSVAALRPRMLDYYHFLRRKHQLPVLPIGFYMRVGLDGIGVDVYEERLWELPILHFQYLYVGLPALPAEEYVNGANWLGVALAALMAVTADRQAWLEAEALRRVRDCPHNEWRRFLLGDFICAYMPLSNEQRHEFKHLLDTEPYQGVREMNQTLASMYYDEGVEQGQRKALQILLEERFGPLDEQVRNRLQLLPGERLDALMRAAIKAQSLQELDLNE